MEVIPVGIFFLKYLSVVKEGPNLGFRQAVVTAPPDEVILLGIIFAKVSTLFPLSFPSGD
jgi:hypothetical protein